MKNLKLYCHKCSHQTNQKITFEESEFAAREVFLEELKGESKWVSEERVWTISKCDGCESINLKISTIHRGRYSEISRSERLFPGEPKRIVPNWIFILNKKYIEILTELYNAFNNKLYRFTVMGIRTVLDVLMLDLVGDSGTFKEKIKKMREEGFISETQKELLGIVIEAGNASIHRGFSPDEETLNDLLDITEHLIKTEALKNKSKNITDKIPQR